MWGRAGVGGRAGATSERRNVRLFIISMSGGRRLPKPSRSACYATPDPNPPPRGGRRGHRFAGGASGRGRTGGPNRDSEFALDRPRNARHAATKGRTECDIRSRSKRFSHAKPRRLTTPAALIEAGLAAPERLAELEAVAARYAIGLTPALAGLVRSDDPADPIARQFIPDRRELVRDPAETDDPIGDDAKSPIRGLVHRYPTGC